MNLSSLPVRRVLAVLALLALGWSTWQAARTFDAPRWTQSSRPSAVDNSPESRFTTQVAPFLQRYCFSCHGPDRQEGTLDLSQHASLEAMVENSRVWEQVRERLHAMEMPPDDAPRHPTAKERAAVLAAVHDLRTELAARHAGDPGIVVARRLSNAEYDYTIRDLTGVDIRPAREFPVDPANEAGFDNSGESLAMSGSLLKKYLAAARMVADHVVLKPGGFVFAPHPVVSETDRDKYCVARIVDFYRRHPVELADYFHAAWSYRHRRALGMPAIGLDELAAESPLSGKYLALIWSALTEGAAEFGPLAVVRQAWDDLPPPDRSRDVRAACVRLRELVVRLRQPLQPEVARLKVNGISPGSQPLVLWHNRQLAAGHRTYAGDVRIDLGKLTAQLKDADKATRSLLTLNERDAESEPRMRASFERFCSVFPDVFVVVDRGPYFDPKQAGRGRPLTAGFHLMQGYFRDDQPLCDLVLSEAERRELDGLWQELNFVAQAALRQYKDFIFFERAEPPRFMYGAEFDFARSEDKDAAAEAKMTRLAALHLARARKLGASGDALAAIETYYASMAADIRWVEWARFAAEPRHLEMLLQFAERAYRRPLTAGERENLLAFYRKLRAEEVGHEEAVRDLLARVLLSPHFCYRVDLQETSASAGTRPLSDYELASRLSYFLWSSTPDQELLSHAAEGDLHQHGVLKAQVRRMLRDAKVRGLATEFVGNWLDVRRFEEHNAVDRDRFPQFTAELRQAMFEEPLRYFLDVVERDRPVLDLLYGRDTSVNAALAKHYGMPAVPQAGSSDANNWFHIADAERYGRGGWLPMAVFLTKNAGGLRTSPVKRGYWIVRRLLGEQIPAPPPAVPELPKDEANVGTLTLPQLLARHREDKNCAGCHRRFDAVGLAFEGYGPVGERRTNDLGGHVVQTVATFPDDVEREGLAGLQTYLREKREGDFVDNLCKKLFAYALGRSLQLSDETTIEAMRSRLKGDGYRLSILIEVIVTSPQFLTGKH